MVMSAEREPNLERSELGLGGRDDTSDASASARPARHGLSSAAPTQVNIELRPEEFDGLVDGRRIRLTMREFQVLETLAQERDRVVQRAEIYRRVWGGEMKHRERSVDVFVRKVRRKLEAVAPQWHYIHTHVGVGYRFSPEEIEDRDRA
jgi:DNA-binding response OmpR family regulator